MKNIFLIGKFNVIFNDINDFFGDLFSTQICVDNAEIVKRMLKIKNPDLVLVSLIGISADAEKIFAELKCNSELPVICIGANEDINKHLDNINTEQFTTLNIPVNKDGMLDLINCVLDAKNNRVAIDDKGIKKSILLVDDSNIQLRALNELLKDNYEVRMATSGMQALTMIGRKKPDMIFLDYEMPVCDGKKTLEMIRELDESKNIPVVFLTGVSDMDHIKAVLSLKPAGYLLKPADANKIYNIIEETIG